MNNEYVRGSDAALSYRWRADPAAIERLGLTQGRTADDRCVQASIIASLRIEADGENRRVSYSRSSDWYDVPGRYRDTPYTRDRVCRTIDRLTEIGLVDNFRQVAGAHLHPVEEKRIQSAVRAYPALLARLGDTPLEYVRRKCPLILRDDAGNFVDYADTQRTERLRAGVDRINGWLGTMDVSVSPDADPANWRRSAHHLHARKLKGDGSETWTCTVLTPVPDVVRIFSRSSFDVHGRYYGGWWQNLPKARRGELLINGEVLVEPDFQWLHPTLLYAMAGEVIAHDPYTTGYWPRQAGKLAFNVAVNARTIQATIEALLAKRYETGDDGEPVWRYGRRQTARILEDIREANKPIAHLFGSDAGVTLMRIDSDMATSVMEGCRKAGVPCLPNHDSFLTPARTEGVVTDIMGDVLTATSNRLYRGKSGTSLRTFLHNGGRGAVPASPASPVEPPPARGPSPTEPPSPAPAGPVSVDPGSVSPNPTGGPVSRTSVLDLAAAFLADLGHDPLSQEPQIPTAIAQRDPARPLPRQMRKDPRPKINGPVRASLAVSLDPPILIPLRKVPMALSQEPPSRPVRPRSWEDCRRPSVWQVTEPDGTVVVGDPLFLAARAAEIRAMGLDPDRRRPPKVAPGL